MRNRTRTRTIHSTIAYPNIRYRIIIAIVKRRGERRDEGARSSGNRNMAWQNLFSTVEKGGKNERQRKATSHSHTHTHTLSLFSINHYSS